MNEAAGRDLDWRRSTACADHACAEVAVDVEFVYVRDGKMPDGAVLRFTRAEWEAFVRGMKSGDFDLV